VYAQLLKNTNFLKIWSAQLLSQIASNLLNFALIIRIFDLAAHTPFANIAVSLLILSFGIPSIIFAVLAGAYVDHLDRRKVLIITNILRAVLVLFFLFFEHNLVMVYVLVFFISTLSQFFTPAEGAALPKLVNKKQFLAANSLFLFTLYSSFVIGYSLAGPVIAAFGGQAVYYLAAIAFALAALLSWGLPKLRPAAIGIHFAEINKQVFSTIRASMRQIFTSRNLIFPIINLTIGQMMINVIAVLAPGLALMLFSQSLAVASVKLIVPAAIGMVVGAIVVGQFLKNIKKTKLITIGIALAAVMLISIIGVYHLRYSDYFVYLVVGFSLGLGFANALVSVSAQTLLQLNSTDEQRGKIFGTLNMMMNMAATIPVLLAGITADLVSPVVVLSGAGVLIAIYGIYQYKVFSGVQLKNA
jgi:MFS family permease